MLKSDFLLNCNCDDLHFARNNKGINDKLISETHLMHVLMQGELNLRQKAINEEKNYFMIHKVSE